MKVTKSWEELKKSQCQVQGHAGRTYLHHSKEEITLNHILCVMEKHFQGAPNATCLFTIWTYCEQLVVCSRVLNLTTNFPQQDVEMS